MENSSCNNNLSFSGFLLSEPNNTNNSVISEDVKVFCEISNPEDVSNSCSGSGSSFEIDSFLRCDEVIDYDAEENAAVVQQQDIDSFKSTYSVTNNSKRNYCDSLEPKPNIEFFNPFDSETEETEQVHVQTEIETEIKIQKLGMQEEQNQYQLSVLTPCGTVLEFLVVASHTPSIGLTTSQTVNDSIKIHVKNEVTMDLTDENDLEAGTDPAEEYVISDIPLTPSKYVLHPPVSSNHVSRPAVSSQSVPHLPVSSRKHVLHPPVASKKKIQHGPEKTRLTTSTLPPKSSHPFACKLCSRELKSEPELKIHVTICGLYHKDRDRLCVPCHRLFSTPSLLERHNFTVHKIVTSRLKDTAAKLVEFQCHICPKTYPSRSLLLTHTESHKKIEEQHRPFKCPMPKCLSSFLRKSDLTSHLKTHSNTKPFNCPHPGCDYTCKFKFTIREHYLTHFGSCQRMKCPFPNCYYTFSLIARLNQHVKKCHKD